MLLIVLPRKSKVKISTLRSAIYTPKPAHLAYFELPTVQPLCNTGEWKRDLEAPRLLREAS